MDSSNNTDSADLTNSANSTGFEQNTNVNLSNSTEMEQNDNTNNNTNDSTNTNQNNIVNNTGNNIENAIIESLTNIADSIIELASIYAQSNNIDLTNRDDDSSDNSSDNSEINLENIDVANTGEQNMDVDVEQVVNGGQMRIIPITGSITNFFQRFNPNQNEIEERLEEIMKWGNDNVWTADPIIVDLVDFHYLKNSEYDDVDEPIQTIKYTVKSVLNTETNYQLKDLVTGIFAYAMSGQNYLFDTNLHMLYDIVKNELNTILTRSARINLLIQHMNAENRHNFEDVKLVLSQEELNKIPIVSYESLNEKTKEINIKCLVCQDAFENESNVRVLGCEHLFHTECIDNWLSSHSYKCPCCRKEAGIHTTKI